MPRVTIRLAETALADLGSVRDSYAEQGVPDIGERFLAEILERVSTLRDHPEKGRIVPDPPTAQPLSRPCTPAIIIVFSSPSLMSDNRVERL